MNAIVDLQGFKKDNNEFILKEIAILCSRQTLVLLIKPPFPFYELSKTERSTVSWIERNRKIFWDEGFIPYSQMSQYITNYLKNKVIYVKGSEKVLWLKNLIQSDQIHNIECYNCPNFQTLYKTYLNCSYVFSCIFHSNVCALRNVTCLNMWLDHKGVLG